MAEKEETRCLVGVGPGTTGFYKPDTRVKKKRAKVKAKAAEAEAKVKAGQHARFKEAGRAMPPGYDEMKNYYRAVGTASSEEESRRLLECGPVIGYPIPFVLPDVTEPGRAWLRLLPFPRPDPEPIRSIKALKAQHDAFLRGKKSRSQLRAFNQKIVLQCLEWYNSKHPDDEYEPAPGVVTKCSDYDDNNLWTHGNFVARQKCSGCFSFLPAPRTLFFFELLYKDGVVEVTACTPIDEPITEAYTFLGFPLGRGTRRHGGADCVCKTCYRQFHVPHIGLKRTCTCGDSKVESVCKMCYLASKVLHPIRGGFVFGQESYAKICR